MLLEYLIYYNNLWSKFEEIDSSDDRRLELHEFKAGCAVLGEHIHEDEAEAIFARMDANGGGFVLFDEFCVWVSERQMGGKALTPDQLLHCMHDAMRCKMETFHHTEARRSCKTRAVCLFV